MTPVANASRGVTAILLALASAGPSLAAQELPRLQFVSPRRSTVTGMTSVVVAQTRRNFDAATVENVVIEYTSADAPEGPWTEIRAIPGLDEEESVISPRIWYAAWDTEALAAGRYLLRATLSFTAGGQAAVRSAHRRVVVNKAPEIPAVSAAAAGEPGLVLFDGSQAVDPDGRVVAWRWDFDIEENLRCEEPIARVRFPDLDQTYPVRLTVADRRRARTQWWGRLEFVGTEPVAKEETKCVCTYIEVADTGKALGPDGVAEGKHWPKTISDGLTLGPLDRNPANRVVRGGNPVKMEKDYAGVTFELRARVDGSPKHCKEVQLLKKTWVQTNGTTQHARFWGTFDRNLDGMNDLQVTTKNECETLGGTYVKKTIQSRTFEACEFARTGTVYVPDGNPAYQRPYDFKEHVGQQILWFDHPAISVNSINEILPPNSKKSTYVTDFISMIRGTDSRYCYVKFTVDLTYQEGQDVETLTVVENVIDAASVPGVP